MRECRVCPLPVRRDFVCDLALPTILALCSERVDWSTLGATLLAMQAQRT
jgi:hypothetical protein